MNYRDILTIFAIFLIIIAIALVIKDIQNIQSEGFKCIQNALSYGAAGFSKANNAELTCVCNFDIQPSPTIFVTSSNITLMSRGNQERIRNFTIDWSKSILNIS